jgi:hypothetical protein
MEGLGGFLFFMLLIVAVFAFLMPFFVFRIRNEVIETNRKLQTLIVLIKGNDGQRPPVIK